MWGWACREDTPVKGTRTPVLPGVLSPPSVPGLGGRVSGTAHARLVRAPAPHPLAGATLQAVSRRLPSVVAGESPVRTLDDDPRGKTHPTPGCLSPTEPACSQASTVLGTARPPVHLGADVGSKGTSWPVPVLTASEVTAFCSSSSPSEATRGVSLETHTFQAHGEAGPTARQGLSDIRGPPDSCGHERASACETGILPAT